MLTQVIIFTAYCRERIDSQGRRVSVTTPYVRVVEPSARGHRRASVLAMAVGVSMNRPLDDRTTEHTASAVPTHRPAGIPLTPL